MTALKPDQIEGFLRRPDPSVRVVLVYGHDEGLVSERAIVLHRASGVDPDDPFTSLRLDSDDLSGDASRLVDEAGTVALFGSKRVVRVRGGETSAIAKALEVVLDLPQCDALIILEGGDLKKTNPVRKIAEAHKSARALPCYADNAHSVQELIDQVLREAKLDIEPAARERLASLLGANRLISRSELNKLVLYVGDDKSISLEAVDLIVGDGSTLALEALSDAAGSGAIDKVERDLKRFELTGVNAAQIAILATRHFQTLHRARSEMETTQKSAKAVIDGLRPPVFFQRRPSLMRQLELWTLRGLDQSLERLDQATLTGRRSPSMAYDAISAALMAIAAMARASAAKMGRAPMR